MDKKTELGVKILELLDDDAFDALDEIFNNGERDVLEITELENWNWLHKALLGFSPDKPSAKAINYLIKRGVNINAQDCYGMTPLHYAMRAKNAEAALLLLKSGADPNIPNQDGLIPLSMIGYIPERLDILEFMLKGGANIYHFVNEGQTILESYKPRPSDNEHIARIYEMMKMYA